MEGGGVYEGDGNLSGGSGFLQGRWPREETLTLLEIRTRLHPKFRQAAAEHKAPLWDEVSRYLMAFFTTNFDNFICHALYHSSACM